MNFLIKKPSTTKHSPPSHVYYMEFYCNFVFHYSLIGIVKSKFFRRNEIWCRIWEIKDLSKNVRKKQDRTSLNNYAIFFSSKKIWFVLLTPTLILIHSLSWYYLFNVQILIWKFRSIRIDQFDHIKMLIELTWQMHGDN